MAVTRTFGSIKLEKRPVSFRKDAAMADHWVIDQCQPHVSIKLKAIFPSINKYSKPPYTFRHNTRTAHDLNWFMERYPLEISASDRSKLNKANKAFHMSVAEAERILIPEYQPAITTLNPGEQARHYQEVGADLANKVKRILCADEIGLGKTITGILALLKAGALPAAVVVQTHLPKQWKRQIERFTQLKVHLIKKSTAYNLPPADVYIFKYTSLSGWVNFFETGYLRHAIFDEIQELRHIGTQKYYACKALSESVEYALGLSATPIYNYGDEIFAVCDCLNPGCLGDYDGFVREWCYYKGQNKIVVSDPKALGMFLRENHIMFRRTRKDVGRELPPKNTLVYEVEYNEGVFDEQEELARTLALSVTSGSFMERGQASREFDSLMRRTTGLAKAPHVAAFIRMVVESDEKVVVGVWHRDVYDVLMSALAEFKPVMYSGSESPSQKEASKEAFINGDSKVFLMSLRSGIGLDGLQNACRFVIYCEMDWSPKVHEQFSGRVDRDRGDILEQTTEVFLYCNGGSDPMVMDVLGLKSSQSQGIVDPMIAVSQQYIDESRVKLMAEKVLAKKGKYHEATAEER